MRISIATLSVVGMLASCTTVPYSHLKGNEHQLAGHPWKSADDCTRTKPIGKFDARCDVPVVGYRGDGDITPHFGVGSGAGGFTL
jgi:hypothetical protein